MSFIPWNIGNSFRKSHFLKIGGLAAAGSTISVGQAFAQVTGTADFTDFETLTTEILGESGSMQGLIDFLTAGAGFVVVGVAVYAGLKMMKALLGYGTGAGMS